MAGPRLDRDPGPPGGGRLEKKRDGPGGQLEQALGRAGLYREPAPESPEGLRSMRLIDERYLAAPFHGSRRMPAWLGRRGEAVNRKRVQRRMRIMGLEAIHPGPRTTVRNPDHEIHRYLLRGVAIDRLDQVWSIDVTYLPPEDGDMFPAAVIDRHSRFALRGGVRTGESVGRFVKQRWAGRYGASTGA